MEMTAILAPLANCALFHWKHLFAQACNRFNIAASSMMNVDSWTHPGNTNFLGHAFRAKTKQKKREEACNVKSL